MFNSEVFTRVLANFPPSSQLCITGPSSTGLRASLLPLTVTQMESGESLSLMVYPSGCGRGSGQTDPLLPSVFSHTSFKVNNFLESSPSDFNVSPIPPDFGMGTRAYKTMWPKCVSFRQTAKKQL